MIDQNKTSKVIVIGYFGYQNNQIDGQTIKTRNVYELISAHFPQYSLEFYDTQTFQTQRLSLLTLFRTLWDSDILIYLPGVRNLKTIFPLIYIICRVRRITMINFVVGGWLGDFLKANRGFLKRFRNFRCILVESDGLKCVLEQDLNFTNVKQFPNFRMQKFFPKNISSDTFRIVFMARITNLKGVDTVLNYAEYLSSHKGKSCRPILIDFYGPIDPEIKDWFLKEVSKYSHVFYKGVIEPKNVYEVLQGYDVLVLPTRYPGEGFPGTVVDAYLSGIPVIVSNWKYLPEAVVHGETGYIYDLESPDDFFSYLDLLSEDVELLHKMKINALKRSTLYSKEKALDVLSTLLDEIQRERT